MVLGLHRHPEPYTWMRFRVSEIRGIGLRVPSRNSDNKNAKPRLYSLSCKPRSSKPSNPPTL